MSSVLYQCAVKGCSHVVLLNNILDLLVPLVLDFLLFSVFVSFVLRTREKKGNKHLRDLALRRTVTLLDRLLCSVLPSSVCRLSPRTIQIGLLEVPIAYGGLLPAFGFMNIGPQVAESIDRRKSRLSVAIERAREEINEVALRHSAHLERKLLQQLIDLEAGLDHSGRAIQVELGTAELAVVAEVIAATARQAGELHSDLLTAIRPQARTVA